jgi:hypothetical protein
MNLGLDDRPMSPRATSADVYKRSVPGLTQMIPITSDWMHQQAASMPFQDRDSINVSATRANVSPLLNALPSQDEWVPDMPPQEEWTPPKSKTSNGLKNIQDSLYETREVLAALYKKQSERIDVIESYLSRSFILLISILVASILILVLVLFAVIYWSVKTQNKTFIS